MSTDLRKPCPHSCCTKNKQYLTGKSSSWKQHISLKSERIHNLCSQNCSGWKYLPESLRNASNTSPKSTDEATLKRDHVFKLLWVLDPTSFTESIEVAELQSEWSEVSLASEDIAMLKDPKLTGYIFDYEEGQAMICDYLDLYRRLPRKSYDKHIMPFQEFQKVVLGGNSKKLEKFDVVVLPFIAVDLWDKEIYNFADDDEVELYLKHLWSFEEDGVHFWPSFAECFAHADKLEQAKRLDTIASNATFSPRPDTRPITLQDALNATEGVLKRSFSDKTSHVYILSDPAEKAKIASNIDKRNVGFLLQTYIPTLITHGELRVAVSYGRVIWRVWTKRHVEGHVEFVDVNHVGEILNVPMENLAANAFDNNYFQTSFQLEIHQNDVDNFAVTTVEELIKLETLHLGYEPSLSTFTRVDIGIMPDADGKAKFFVNEIERLPAVTLWRGPHHIGPVAANFDHGLYKVLMSNCV